MKILLNIFVVLNILFAQVIKVQASFSDEVKEIEEKIKNVSINFQAKDILDNVLCNHSLLHVYKYLKHYDLANIQFVNKSLNKHLNENQEIWREFFVKSLKMKDLGPKADYKDLVKLYYQPTIQIIKKINSYKESKMLNFLWQTI